MKVISNLNILAFPLNKVIIFIVIHIERIYGVPTKGHIERVVKLISCRGILTNLNGAFNCNFNLFHVLRL